MMQKSILIVIPSIDSKMHTHATISLLKMEKILNENKINVSCLFPVGSLISRVRNEAVTYFLNYDFDYLLFIDSDLSGFENAILKLIQADKDIIGCTYPKKAIKKKFINYDITHSVKNHNCRDCVDFNINLFKSINETIKDLIDFGGIIEVKNLPTGCMLIKKEVFEKILKLKGNNIFYYDYTSQTRNYDFFQVGIRDGRYMSEDYGFNELCKDCDIKSYCNFNFNLSHYGELAYKGNFYEHLNKYININNSKGQ